MNGIDVSKYQKGMSLSEAKKSGYDFVIIRAAYSTAKDNCFEGFYAAAKACGQKVGAYQYGIALTPEAARSEANFMISALQGKQFEFPIFYDIEDKTQSGLSADRQKEIVTAWSYTMEQAGYWAGFYCSTDWLQKLTPLEKRFTYWRADWTSHSYTDEIRQTSGGTGRVCGMPCDIDVSTRDFETEIKASGINGFTKAAKADSFLGAKGFYKRGDKCANIGKISAFMRTNFPIYTDKKALGTTYGPYLEASIREFQKRTGLDPDGMFGPKTLAELEKYGFKK